MKGEQTMLVHNGSPHRILKHLRTHHPRGCSLREIGEVLGLGRPNRTGFRSTIDHMMRRGLMVKLIVPSKSWKSHRTYYRISHYGRLMCEEVER